MVSEFLVVELYFLGTYVCKGEPTQIFLSVELFFHFMLDPTYMLGQNQQQINKLPTCSRHIANIPSYGTYPSKSRSTAVVFIT
jgi:hypothetical protein